MNLQKITFYLLIAYILAQQTSNIQSEINTNLKKLSSNIKEKSYIDTLLSIMITFCFFSLISSAIAIIIFNLTNTPGLRSDFDIPDNINDITRNEKDEKETKNNICESGYELMSTNELESELPDNKSIRDI